MEDRSRFYVLATCDDGSQWDVDMPSRTAARQAKATMGQGKIFNPGTHHARRIVSATVKDRSKS